jgi:DNA (cytosine-5)-methyltransferase 1
LQPIAFSGQMSNPQTDVDMTQTQQAKNPMAVAQPVYSFIQASAQKKSTNSVLEELSNTLTARAENNNFAGGVSMAVRRLTPVECERLQGFPDSYTDIKSKNKPTPDGPRYKALGNSMAVPVMAWIGQRIQEVEQLSE